VWTGLTSFFSTLESTFATSADAQLLIFLVGNFSKEGGQGVTALASYVTHVPQCLFVTPCACTRRALTAWLPLSPRTKRC
jgi:hypothetical protein